MRLIELKCPSCGANLRLDMEAQQAFCPHCGHQLIVDDGRVRADSRSFHEAGYQFERGRMQAQREQAQSAPPAAAPQPIVTPQMRAEDWRQARITRITRWLTVIGSLIFWFNALSIRMHKSIAVGGALILCGFVICSRRFNWFLRTIVISLMLIVLLARIW